MSSRLNSDCNEMAGDLTWFFRFSIESVVRITGITAYMLFRSPILGATALSIVVPLVVAVINKLYVEQGTHEELVSLASTLSCSPSHKGVYSRMVEPEKPV